MATTARTGDEKVEDPEIIFERFKKAVSAIAAAPKGKLKNAVSRNGQAAAKKPRKKRA
jgi:hypothetical protein